MPRDAAHTAPWRTFEVVCGGPVALSIVLHLWVPWSFGSGRLALVLLAVGLALVIAGVAVVARARTVLRRHGQPTDPGRPTRSLVTNDVFAVSRNPLYLGGIGTLAGLALVFDLPWTLVLLGPAAVACQHLLILPEERYLRATFGATYDAYVRRVGRWFGRAP
jgi:protein-S-isoprenylcysteine O-methyltransferase Ste14